MNRAEHFGAQLVLLLARAYGHERHKQRTARVGAQTHDDTR